MLYTVKEVSKLSGVTIKALHHYHKIGLLVPCEITDAGYRLYGTYELERLQQILFYRELEFPLSDIKKALEDESGRLECLAKQQELLIARQQRLHCLLKTINESISLTKKGENMENSRMFKGLNKEDWDNALSKQSEYLKEKYGYDLPEVKPAQVEELNEKAKEAKSFMDFLSNALKNGWKASDERILSAIGRHLDFLNSHGIKTDANAFLAQSRFFLEDDFHRNMLEGQQTGLSYYMCFAAEKYANIKTE